MDLVQRRQQLRQKQVEKVKKFRQSNMSTSAAVEKQRDSDAAEKQKESAVKQKQKEREQMKKEVRKEIEKETQNESIDIENSDGTVFARVMNIIGPTNMKPMVSNGVWKGTEQISEKKSDCECDDCGQDPCIECGESHHSVKEQLVSERLGGKGYKSYTSLTGKKVSGDWEDSDRGAGNKAKKRAGGKVEKKSPTYQAYVLNKEAKEEQGRSDYGKASVRNKRKFGTSGEMPDIMTGKKITKDATRGELIDKRREEHKAKRGVKEDYYSGTGEKVVARTKKWMDKKGQKGAPGLDAMKARAAEHKAKRGVKKESISYGSQTAREGDNEAAAAARKRIYDRASAKDKDHMDAVEIANQRNKKRYGKVVVTKEDLQYDWRSDDSMRINKIFEGKKKGLWDNIHAKRKRGEKPAKPGDKDYPKTLDVE